MCVCVREREKEVQGAGKFMMLVKQTPTDTHYITHTTHTRIEYSKLTQTS